jgi:hypothetical protein
MKSKLPSITLSSLLPLLSLQFLNPTTAGRTSWTGDEPVARTLPTHKQNKQTGIHALSGIRSHDHNVRAGEGSSCLRRSGHCDRHLITLYCLKTESVLILKLI